MSSARILLVDDDPQVRRALRTTLTSAGYVIVEAWTGEEALERLVESSIDMVLLDLKMPGIGGVETCRRIRKVSDVPVLVISVLRTEEDQRRTLDAGSNDYLIKPFGIRELLSRMEALQQRSAILETASIV